MIRHYAISISIALSMICATDTLAAGVQMLGKGVGSSCGIWSAERKTKVSWLYGANWVLGFMSGAASAVDRDFLDGLNSEAVLGWMDNYCKAHPLEKIANAANKLLQQRSLDMK